MQMRKVKKRDLEKVLDLFAVSAPRHIRNHLFYRWRNYGSYFKNALGYVAEDERKNIIAHYAILPQTFVVDGRFVQAGMGQQAVVHPDHRDIRNIYRLVEFALTHAKDQGIEFVYAFPNKNMVGLTQHVLKWEPVAGFSTRDISMAVMEKAVDNALTGLKKNGQPSVCRITGDTLKAFLKDGGSLLSRNPPCGVALLKSPAYFKWRFYENPLEYYAVFALQLTPGAYGGYIVLKLYPAGPVMTGHILSFEYDGRSEALMLLEKAVGYFKQLRVRKLVLWNVGLLEALLGGPLKAKEGFITHLYCKNLSAREDVMARIGDINNWQLCMDYSDAF